jgi:hypothetical protein
MINNEQIIFTIRSIYPQITANDHGRKYWVLSKMDGSTQISPAEIYLWDFTDIERPTVGQINAAWAANGSSMRPPVPTSCTRKQGKLALLQAGKLDQILALVSSAPRAVQVAFNDADTYERADSNLIYLAGLANMTSADLDQLFTIAVTF